MDSGVFSCKALSLKDLRQITVVGLGLLGASITLAIKRRMKNIRTVGYAHRPSTRLKAKKLKVADFITGDLRESVAGSDMVILATPICIFDKIFSEIGKSLPAGCIVTDVGSTKMLPHQWAKKRLPKNIYYAGSHPIAGSEQRGVEFAKDDLLENSLCIITKNPGTNNKAVAMLRKFWTALGCKVKIMNPKEHDRILANISHLPHMTAAALVNANTLDDMKFAGRGFTDTTRIASGPENIWTDILYTNKTNCIEGIDRLIAELGKIRKAVKSGSKADVEKILSKAREKRNMMLRNKNNIRESEL